MYTDRVPGPVKAARRPVSIISIYTEKPDFVTCNLYFTNRADPVVAENAVRVPGCRMS